MLIAKRFMSTNYKYRPVTDLSKLSSTTVQSTLEAIRLYEDTWGSDEHTEKFRELVQGRGTSIFDYRITNHLTASTLILNTQRDAILMTYHPWYKLWLQLGGHDSIKFPQYHPLGIAAKEALEESAKDDLLICDTPILIDVHAAPQCKAPADTSNLHYDICYVAMSKTDHFLISQESEMMKWVSVSELKDLIISSIAQERVMNMFERSMVVFS